MRLSLKLVGTVLLGVVALLGIDGYLSVQREIDQFEVDMQRDAHVLGNTLKGLVLDVWEARGEEKALDLLHAANTKAEHVEVRWVWLDASPGEPLAPRVPAEDLGAVRRGEEATVRKALPDRPGHLYTYVPVPVENPQTGAIEVSEPLTDLEAYTRETVTRMAVLVGLMVTLGGLALVFLGMRFVAHPLDRLVSKADRIGGGDLSGDLVLPGRDELSLLAAAMNQMCERLAAARDAIRQESAARIAALEQLRHAERLALLGQLSAGMAHELGTPLNVVGGKARMLATQAVPPEEVAESARIIEEQAERMTRTVRELLDFARRRPPRKSPTDLVPVVRQVLDLLSTTAKKEGITLRCVERDGIPMIPADRYQVEQVIANLVRNGMQAMPDGGLLEVTFHYPADSAGVPARKGEGSFLMIQVEDGGTGISPEDQARVFEPFFTSKPAGQGTGLGLPIALGIVQEHGGWIDLDSEPGQGSRFRVYLPAGESSERPDPDRG